MQLCPSTLLGCDKVTLFLYTGQGQLSKSNLQVWHHARTLGESSAGEPCILMLDTPNLCQTYSLLPYTNMNRQTPKAQHSALKGLYGSLLRPHISGAMKAGVPGVLLTSASAEGYKTRHRTKLVTAATSRFEFCHATSGSLPRERA